MNTKINTYVEDGGNIVNKKYQKKLLYIVWWGCNTYIVLHHVLVNFFYQNISLKNIIIGAVIAWIISCVSLFKLNEMDNIIHENITPERVKMGYFTIFMLFSVIIGILVIANRAV